MDRNPLCRPATAWLMTRLLNVQRQAQAISINQQLLNAHLRNLATQQIAYDGLMLMNSPWTPEGPTLTRRVVPFTRSRT